MANEFLMRKGYKSLANSEITGSLITTGNISAEDNIFLTDAGTIRAKLILNSSDRDNVELRAESLGSTMKFFTVGTEALGLDASQNASFAGNITLNGNTTATEYLSQANNGQFRVQTLYGYAEMGPANASYNHFGTDRPTNYFNKSLTVDTGLVSSYDEDLILRRTTNSNTQLTISTTGGVFTGTVTATSFTGSGAGLTGVTGTDATKVSLTGNETISGVKQFSNYINAAANIQMTGHLYNSNDYNSIDLVDHSGYTWFRNSSNRWVFQGGTAGDDWTQSFHFNLETTGGGFNDKVLLLGQQQNNGSAGGKYKGVRIVKSTGSSSVVDGYLQAGTAKLTGVLSLGPGTTGAPYDVTTFLHVKGTTRSIVQQSSTTDAYYMFGDAAANNAGWLGYLHNTGTIEIHAQSNVTIDKSTSITGDLSVTGTITAQQFKSELVSASILYESGSTKFGDTSGDNHDFTGSLNLDGDLTLASTHKIIIGPNSTWSKSLIIGNDSNNSTADAASIGTTNGNLHLDAAIGASATYLNYYDGTGGVYFGSGAGGSVAVMGPDGDLWKGSSDNAGSKYWHAGNDGPTSGLAAQTAATATTASNAMLLDGINSTSFLRSDTTDTATGAITFTSAQNHYKGHFYYDAYDSAGNHYVHFNDGADNGGTTVNWRQYYGSSLKTHTWTSDTNGNMNFTYQGTIYGTSMVQGGTALMKDASGISVFGSNSGTRSIRVGRDGTSNDIFITGSNGNVGIGTPNPVSKLQVGDHMATNTLTIGGFYANGGGVLAFRSGYAPNLAYIWNTAEIKATDDGNFNGRIEFKTSTSGRQAPAIKMVLKANGRLGIGSSSPQSLLDVGAIVHIDQDGTYGGSYGMVGFGGTTNGFNRVFGHTSTGDGLFLASATGRGIFFRPNGSTGDAVTITALGLMGIGTTSPTSTLSVHRANSRISANSTADQQQIGFEAKYLTHATLKGTFLYSTGNATLDIANHFAGNNGVYSDIYFKNTNNGSGTLQTRMTIKGSSGNVGIGTISPSAKLEVYGSGSTVFEVNGSQGQLFSITDSLSGSLFSVSDISGTPLLEVESDSTVTLGDYNTNALVVTGSLVGMGLAVPTAKLHVQDLITNGATGADLGPLVRISKGASPIGKIRYDTVVIETNDVATIRIGESDGTVSSISSGDNNLRINSTDPIKFYTNGTTTGEAHGGQGGTLALTIANNQSAQFTAGVSATTFTGALSGNATSANYLGPYGNITTQAGTGTLIHTGPIAASQTGLFAASDNSNSIITVSRHSGNYYSQLGFSSNGNLYYRKFSNVAINTSQAWKTIAFTDSNITGNAATATNADKLDNLDSTDFLRLASNNLASGVNSFSNSYNEFGNGYASVSNDGGWNGRVNVAGSSHARLDVKSVSDGIITSMYSHTGHAAGKVGTMSNHPLSFMINGNTKATLTAAGNLTATTFTGALTGTATNATSASHAIFANTAATANAVTLGSLIVDGKLVLDLPSNSTERGPWNPIATSIRNSGRRLYQDEEFRVGSNGTGVYNNSGGTGVVITREADSTTLGASAPNSSGFVLKIVHDGNTTSPGHGGFINSIPSQDNQTFVQLFQAKLDTGRSLVIAENAQGSNNTSYWLTNTAGTGKWEWYARVSHCGDSGTFNGGGHVYVSGGSSAFTWYLASTSVYNVTDARKGGKFELPVVMTATGTANAATLSIDNPSSSTYIHSIEAFAANNAANQNNILVVGKSGTTKNSGYIGYKWAANASNTNVLTFGHWGSDNLMNITGDGKVGIGTTDPDEKLDVIGDIRTNRRYLIATGTANENMAIGFWDSATARIEAGSSHPMLITSYQGNINLGISGGTTMVVQAGKVGIGTTAPAGPLNINIGTGGSNGKMALRIGGTSNYASLELGVIGAYGGMLRSYGNDLHYYSGHWRTIGAVATEHHSHYWYTSRSGSADWSNVKMELSENGNLGVGIISNDHRLRVDGRTQTTTLKVGLDTSTGNGEQIYDGYVNGSSAYLHEPRVIIRNDSSATGAIDQATLGLSIFNLNGTNSTWSKLSFATREVPGGGNTVSIAGIAAQKTAGVNGSWATGDLHLYTKAGPLHVTNMVLKSTGKVGIGTATPDARLHVVSTVPTTAIFDTTSSSYGAMNVFKAQGVVKGNAGYNSGAMYFGGESGTNTIIQSGGQTGIFVDKSTRNVGIGIASAFNKLQVGSNTFTGANGMYTNGRVGISNHGTLTGMMLASTYNDAAHPEYGLVFVQGPSTSAYNVWSISPDGPAKGSSLNFHWQAQSTNIHAPSNAKVTFEGSTGNVGIGTSSPSAKLDVYGSGSTIVDIQGSQGQLFSVTDDLTGDLLNISDISGIPILSVNASGTSSFDGAVEIDGNTNVTGSLTATSFVGPLTGNVTGNAATATNATNLFGAGGSYIQSTSSGTSYTDNYQIRENYGGGSNSAIAGAPTLGFHWSGVVASSIMMEASGRISIRNNPGTSYEDFIADTITAASFVGPLTGTATTASNAMLLDGLDSTSFLRSDAADTVSGDISFTGGQGAITITNSSILSAGTSAWTGDPGSSGKIQYHSNRWYIVADSASNRIVQFRRNGSDKSYIDNNGVFVGAVSGNATTATSATSASHASTAAAATTFGGQASSYFHSQASTGLAGVNRITTISNFNNSLPSGFYQSDTASNMPGTSWHNMLNVRHSNNGNDHGFQQSMSYYNEHLYTRTYSGGTGANDGTFTTWAKQWSDRNDGASSGLDADKVDGIQGASLLRSDAADTFTGTLTMGTQKALIANNYGRGVYGLYSSTRYQHIWSMGAAYNLTDDGTGSGNLYGLAFTHTNVNGQSKAGLGHQMLILENGSTTSAIGNGMWTNGGYTVQNSYGSGKFGLYYGSMMLDGGTAAHTYYIGEPSRTTAQNLIVGGAISAEGDITAFLSSDSRLKENIKPIENSLEKINKLNGVTFDWIKLTKEEQDTKFQYKEGSDIGVIAQEVEEVLPELVTTRKSGYKAVDYQKLTAVLIEAMKEQQVQIDELKSTVNKLQKNA